jgi:hypothetical protein
MPRASLSKVKPARLTHSAAWRFPAGGIGDVIEPGPQGGKGTDSDRGE